MNHKLTALLLAACCIGLASEAAAQRPGPRPKPGAIFDKLDKNHDGKLTQDEVPAKLWARISKADADKDGGVTKKELLAAHKGKKGNKGNAKRKLVALFRRLDKNNDRKLTQDEVPAKLWARLSKADADKDGAVTPKEIAAALKRRKQN